MTDINNFISTVSSSEWKRINNDEDMYTYVMNKAAEMDLPTSKAMLHLIATSNNRNVRIMAAYIFIALETENDIDEAEERAEGYFRPATAEERASVNDYVESISTPIDPNKTFFDYLEEGNETDSN